MGFVAGIFPDSQFYMNAADTIQAFHALYSGGVAQSLRDAGNPHAMPPWAETYWLGKQVVKCPMDLWVYQEIIIETRPEVLIETGTSGGGSAYFFATLFDLIGCGHVVTVDKDHYPVLWKKHPRITYLIGDSLSEDTAGIMRDAAAGKRTMVSLDSLHTYDHVRAELALYGELVSPGCYLVVEDTGLGNSGWGNPDDTWEKRAAAGAAAEFLAAHPGFEVDASRERHLLTSNHDGWIRRNS
jgi:cephalosporin hydroxylase